MGATGEKGGKGAKGGILDFALEPSPPPNPPHHCSRRYWEPLEMLRRIFMTGFLVVLARGSYAQIQFCLLVTMVAISMLNTRVPFCKDTDNNVAQAMLWQTAVTLLLCVLVKSEKEVSGDGELGLGVVDAMMVVAQLLFVPLLMYKKFKGDRAGEGGALASVVPIGGDEGVVSLEENQAEQESWQEQLTQALAEADVLRAKAAEADALRAAEADALRSRAVNAEAKAAAEADALRAKAAAEADALRSRAVDAEAKAADADTLKAALAKAEGELLRLKQE